MKKFESTIIIKASPEQVWAVVAEVMRWPESLPTVTRVEPLDSNSLKIGARYKISQPKLPLTTWTVSELNPRSFAWESRSPGLHTLATHAIDALSPVEVKVTLRIIFSGFFSGMAALLKGSLTQDYLNWEAAGFKDAALKLSGLNPPPV